ncbi:MAG: SatD family protein [Eubacteriales bacterium]|nr:SatD family protein [Eubacteriales bacterium]
MYCALIGDIIHSKEIINRKQFQNDLLRTLTEINKDYSDDIASSFTITLGDEFQALLKTPHHLVRMIETIKEAIYPTRVRIGIGIGDMVTAIDKSSALGADGPAYNYARDILSMIKDSEDKYEMPARETGIMSGDRAARFSDSLINAAFSLCTLTEKKWSASQRQKIYAYIKYNNAMNQREIADELGIGQPALQKGLDRSGYYTYRYVLDAIQKTLTDSWKEYNDQ